MDVSISTLVTVILVASAASIASYWISQWSPLRDRGPISWWIGISIGVGLLIAAAAIAILSLRLPANLQMSAVTEWFDADDINTFEHSDTYARSATSQDSSTRPVSAADTQSIRVVPANSPVTTFTDLWMATECVWAWRPDPTNMTRWLIENQCGTPVAVIVAGCLEEMAFCDDYSQPVWNYRPVDMLLPAKSQRSVSNDEQSIAGNAIRFYACAVTDPDAVWLIGLDPATRSSPPYEEQFDAARGMDACLTEIAGWNGVGRASFMLVPALQGQQPKIGRSPEQLWVGR